MSGRPLARDLARTAAVPNLYTNERGQGCHESLLRAFQILERVKTMLSDGVPHDYILLLIEVMEGGCAKERTQIHEPTIEPLCDPGGIKPRSYEKWSSDDPVR